MNKRIIPREDGRLKWLCNEAFFGFRDRILPERYRSSIIANKALALGLGFAAGVGVAEFGEDFLESYSIPVDPVASHALVATAALYPLARIIAPKYLRQYLEENPLYSRGVLGVMVGASVKALESLIT